MIIAKTNLKKIPDSCTKCKFSKTIDKNNWRSCQKACMLSNNKEIEYKYIPEKRNWRYIKPTWCPLVDLNI